MEIGGFKKDFYTIWHNQTILDSDYGVSLLKQVMNHPENEVNYNQPTTLPNKKVTLIPHHFWDRVVLTFNILFASTRANFEQAFNRVHVAKEKFEQHEIAVTHHAAVKVMLAHSISKKEPIEQAIKNLEKELESNQKECQEEIKRKKKALNESKREIQSRIDFLEKNCAAISSYPTKVKAYQQFISSNWYAINPNKQDRFSTVRKNFLKTPEQIKLEEELEQTQKYIEALNLELNFDQLDEHWGKEYLEKAKTELLAEKDSLASLIELCEDSIQKNQRFYQENAKLIQAQIQKERFELAHIEAKIATQQKVVQEAARVLNLNVADSSLNLGVPSVATEISRAAMPESVAPKAKISLEQQAIQEIARLITPAFGVTWSLLFTRLKEAKDVTSAVESWSCDDQGHYTLKLTQEVKLGILTPIDKDTVEPMVMTFGPVIKGQLKQSSEWSVMEYSEGMKVKVNLAGLGICEATILRMKCAQNKNADIKIDLRAQKGLFKISPEKRSSQALMDEQWQNAVIVDDADAFILNPFKS